MKHVKTLNKANLKKLLQRVAAASARLPASLLARPPAQLQTRNASTQNKFASRLRLKQIGAAVLSYCFAYRDF